jgi:hypothetical protein
MIAFWKKALCSLAEVDRRFSDSYCHHRQDLIMETVNTPETSFSFYKTTRHITEHCLHTRRRKKLKSHLGLLRVTLSYGRQTLVLACNLV